MINLKTTKALTILVLQTLLVAATQVIEWRPDFGCWHHPEEIERQHEGPLTLLQRLRFLRARNGEIIVRNFSGLSATRPNASRIAVALNNSEVRMSTSRCSNRCAPTLALRTTPFRGKAIEFDRDNHAVCGTVDQSFVPSGCEENCIGTVFVWNGRVLYFRRRCRPP
jgi:hypothetical protein